MPSSLPIDALLPEIAAALTARHRLVLEAPPGAGKTTRVAPALLSQPWLAGRRIVMLEPRRLAARAAARRMAAERGEQTGETIGFRVRGETSVGPRTRIEVVTEGILTRMLQDDLSLDGVGLLIFDEFHERSLVADTGLALVLGGTMLLRDDLRLLVMSATLDGAAVASLLNGAPVIQSAGRSFPVETRWVSPNGRQVEAHVVATVRETLESETGSVLVFLPGASEIRRVAELLNSRLPANVDLMPLHGMMSPAAQDAAIAPARSGRRKVVLATNVAETSITIDGIRVVVDSGLERIPRFSPRTGMSRLETVRISRASADQRQGRAGRTEPGIAIRCWSQADDAGLLPGTRAEIVDADLAPLALDLAVAGFSSPDELPWLDAPPTAAYAVARQLLAMLGALDTSGQPTSHGREMSRLGMQPRLAHMILHAREAGAASAARAVALAVLLEDRDILRGEGGGLPADIRLRLDLLERSGSELPGGTVVDRGGLARARDRVTELLRRIGNPAPDPFTAADVGSLLALAWPERLAQRRDVAGRFLLRNGRGATLHPNDSLAASSWLVVPALDDAGRDGRVQLAAPIDEAAVMVIAECEGATVDEVAWDSTAHRVVARRRRMLDALTLADHMMSSPDPARVREVLLNGIRREGLATLSWPAAVQQLRQRLAFLHHHDGSWPDVSDAALAASLDIWLAPFCKSARSFEEISVTDVVAALRSLLSWPRQQELDELAPERSLVPSGSRIAIDYADPAAPVLAVRLQEVFGMAETPRLLGGRVPVLMHLLSPARRPVQITRDLASFWRTGYFDVRKELRIRYPKHSWPEDPIGATAVSGVKRRK